MAKLPGNLVRFLVVFGGAYLLWYFLYDFYLKPKTTFDERVIDNLVVLSEFELKALGFSLIQYDDGQFKNHIGIEGSKGVTIGASCDGIVLFALFTIFILAFQGPRRHKFWFIPAGILAIHLVNSFRVTALAWIVHVDEKWLAFNHDYTFTIIVYSLVFFAWYVWVKKFAARN